MGIKEQYATVRKDIDEYCIEIGRDPHGVLLVAVSKTVGLEKIDEALRAGVTDFGENRPEALVEKYNEYPQATWHFIGNVQSRRIDDIVGCSQLIHSIYKLEHLSKLDAAAKRHQKVQDILAEVNVSGEQSKGGLSPDEVSSFLEESLRYENIRVKGLMTMAPQGNRVIAKECFIELAHLRNRLNQDYLQSNRYLHELSMGMSEDWREAVSAGATIVRIGRAVFDDRFA